MRNQTWEGNRRTKYVRKRDIKPKEWYMIDIHDPLQPNVPSKHFKKRKEVAIVIEREFGLSPLVFPIQGEALIRHGKLLNCTTTRKWGKVFRKYDYTGNPDRKMLTAQRRNIFKGM